MLCKNVPVQKRWTRCPAKRRPALRGTRKSIRKRPDCAISRRAIRACPGVTFRRLRRFFFAFHTDIALRRMPVPFFHDAGNNAPSKARFNRYSLCNLRSPDKTARHRPPRRRNKRGAFPCGAAAAAHPRADVPQKGRIRQHFFRHCEMRRLRAQYVLNRNAEEGLAGQSVLRRI